MAATTQKSVSQALHLNFQSVQQVVVTGNDGDRWVTTVREAAQACRSALDQEAWQHEFEGFLGKIHQWATQHAQDVSAAFVGVSSEGLTGVIVTKGQEYRQDLDDAITALDIELAKNFPSCRADVLQSPEGEPETRIPYISLERAVQVYGNKN